MIVGFERLILLHDEGWIWDCRDEDGEQCLEVDPRISTDFWQEEGGFAEWRRGLQELERKGGFFSRGDGSIT